MPDNLVAILGISSNPNTTSKITKSVRVTVEPNRCANRATNWTMVLGSKKLSRDSNERVTPRGFSVSAMALLHSSSRCS